MATINLLGACDIVENNIDKSKYNGSIYQIANGIVRLILMENYDDLTVSDEQIIATLTSCGLEDTSDWKKLYNAVAEHVENKLGEKAHKRHLPYRYVSGIFTIPYYDIGPSRSVLEKCDTRLSVDISVFYDIIAKGLVTFKHIKPESMKEISRTYVDYMARGFFHGFAKENISYPLEHYFDRDELISLLEERDRADLVDCDNADEYVPNDMEGVDILSLFTEVFAEMDTTLSNVFYNLMEGLSLTEENVVYLYRTDHYNRIKILVDRQSIKDKVFLAVFDHKHAALAEVKDENFNFCMSNL